MFRFSTVFALLFVSLNLFGQSTLQPVSPFLTTEYAQLAGDLLKSFATEPDEKVLETQVPEVWKSWSTVENYTFGKDRGNLPMIADLNSLHPYFRDKISSLISMCAAKGIELAVVETFRTHSKQDEYRSMGKNYTRSGGGRSKHQYGLAVDVVPIVNCEPQWDNTRLWKKVGVIGEQLGLRWGGRWKSLYDPGHFEWTGGLTSTQLASGTFPRIPKPDLYPCLNEELEKLTQAWQAWEMEQSAVSRKEVSVSGMR